MPQRKRPPEDQEPLSPERRARILAGAAAIFIAQGYEGASMSQIAAEANVSKGTLYNYYPAKRELFAAFIRESCGLLVNEIFSEMPPGLPPREGLLRIGRVMLRMMVSPRGLAMFRLVVMEAAKFPDLAAVFTEAGPAMMVRRMTQWLEVRIAAGQMAIPDPGFAAEQFFALTQTRLLLRARLDLAYAASDAEIEHVVDGAAAMFVASYGTSGATI